ncbi:6d24efdd-47e8-48fc-a4f6-c9a3cf6d6fdb [Thermothielavioides terrestris]|uniref:6d24efdd-47e8-48fc-a4f6-c9a3cf6d6fdb n=1 Tax=Thermothielavioides terrestris TaxID=2587410 RepID=A0A446BYL5_9PEZI|nr:6d24efdd-47e8-48fc-a4f6-c9a3cf6d6fdb [Thermothielavioides terrestris]
MAPKRKTRDAATPDRAAVSRGRSKQVSKPSPASDGNESELLISRPAKRARGAAARAARREDNSDDDWGNYGRGSWKPTTIEQHLMDQNRKSKEFIQGFKEQVAQGRERALENLAKLKQDLQPITSLQPHDTVSDNLSELYATLPTSVPGLSAKDNPLFAQTQQLIRLSRAILKCHQEADRDSRAPPDLASPRETWKQDEEGMRKLLEYGRLHAEKVVEGWITPTAEERQREMEGVGDDQGESGEENGELSEAENLAKGLFEWRNKERKALLEWKESWGVAAKRQMVALAGVVRTLPSKGDA